MAGPLNPVLGALEAFLAIYNNLPTAVYFFINLSLLLAVVVVVIQLIFRFRG